MEKIQVLIAYGTRYGATTSTAEEIAKVLQDEGLEVRVVNLKKEKIKDITNYELVIIGSGMKMEMWTSKAKTFLNKFSSELKKKLSLIHISEPTRPY